MGNFSQKVDKFIDIFLNQNGYVKVVQGLHNTLLIAICGLIIGIVIGTESYLQLLRCIIQRNSYGSSAPYLLLCTPSDFWGEDYRSTGFYGCIWSE